MTTDIASTSAIPFAQRLRDLIKAKAQPNADLAKAAGLDPSLVSRLAADSDDARRSPKIEHLIALARALDVLPAELVAGTDAADVLGAWVPRSEYDREARARLDAQVEAAQARTDAAGLRGQIESLRRQIAATDQAKVAAERRAAHAIEQVAAAAAGAEQARVERDSALATAQRLEAERNHIRAEAASARQQMLAAKGAEARNAGLALFGTLLGGVIGAALASPNDDDAGAQPPRTRRPVRRPGQR